jgi:hypothetical protein
VSVSERPAAGNDIAILVVTNSFEFPDRVDQLQVAHMLTLLAQNTIDEVIGPAERQFSHSVSAFFAP